MAFLDQAHATRRRVLGGALALITVASTLGCAPQSGAERVPEYPFDQKTRYAWVTDDLVLIQLGDEQSTVRTEANETLLRTAIDDALGKRGYTKVARDEADVLVAFTVDTTQRYRVEGSTSSSIAGLEPGTKQTKGRLSVYFVDRADHREVWHGWTTRWLAKGEEPAKVVHEAVARALADLPVK